MTKSVLFSNAWKIAKKGAKEFGGSAREYFSEALKKAWRLFKEFNNGSLKPLEIKQWFINKNFSHQEKFVVDYSYDRTVERETAKAVLIKFASDYGMITKWVPKSCLAA